MMLPLVSESETVVPPMLVDIVMSGSVFATMLSATGPGLLT